MILYISLLLSLPLAQSGGMFNSEGLTLGAVLGNNNSTGPYNFKYKVDSKSVFSSYLFPGRKLELSGAYSFQEVIYDSSGLSSLNHWWKIYTFGGSYYVRISFYTQLRNYPFHRSKGQYNPKIHHVIYAHPKFH